MCEEVCVFSLYIFWQSQGWSPRTDVLLEKVVKQAKTTKHPWLIACDANMNATNIEKRVWSQSKHMLIEAPAEEVSTCRSRGPKR